MAAVRQGQLRVAVAAVTAAITVAAPAAVPAVQLGTVLQGRTVVVVVVLKMASAAVTAVTAPNGMPPTALAEGAEEEITQTVLQEMQEMAGRTAAGAGGHLPNLQTQRALEAQAAMELLSSPIRQTRRLFTVHLPACVHQDGGVQITGRFLLTGTPPTTPSRSLAAAEAEAGGLICRKAAMEAEAGEMLSLRM